MCELCAVGHPLSMCDSVCLSVCLRLSLPLLLSHGEYAPADVHPFTPQLVEKSQRHGGVVALGEVTSCSHVHHSQFRNSSAEFQGWREHMCVSLLLGAP